MSAVGDTATCSEPKRGDSILRTPLRVYRGESHCCNRTLLNNHSSELLNRPMGNFSQESLLNISGTRRSRQSLLRVSLSGCVKQALSFHPRTEQTLRALLAPTKSHRGKTKRYLSRRGHHSGMRFFLLLMHGLLNRFVAQRHSWRGSTSPSGYDSDNSPFQAPMSKWVDTLIRANTQKSPRTHLPRTTRFFRSVYNPSWINLRQVPMANVLLHPLKFRARREGDWASDPLCRWKGHTLLRT